MTSRDVQNVLRNNSLDNFHTDFRHCVSDGESE